MKERPSQSEPTEDTEPKKKKKGTGITLCIPTDKGFVDRDLAECSAEEFVTWAQRCYPGKITKNVSKFESITNRRLALRQIERFYASGMTKEQLLTKH